MTQLQTALPALLQQQIETQPPGTPVTVCAQDESRVGLLPIVRRRITACGGQPITTVQHKFDNFYLDGAIDPTTGDSCFLELPWLNTSALQLWLDHFAQAFPQSFNVLILDNGAFHKTKAWRWPSNVTPIFLPPYSPELNPLERLWRDLKDQWADGALKTLNERSEISGPMLPRYSQAALRSCTSYTYFLQAVAAVTQGRNG